MTFLGTVSDDPIGWRVISTSDNWPKTSPVGALVRKQSGHLLIGRTLVGTLRMKQWNEPRVGWELRGIHSTSPSSTS